MPIKKFLAATLVAVVMTGCGGGSDDETPNLPAPDPNVLSMTKGVDDGSEGTLRWAILKNNAEPGRYRIALKPPAGSNLVIKPTSLLPGIVGPAQATGPIDRRGNADGDPGRLGGY